MTDEEDVAVLRGAWAATCAVAGVGHADLAFRLLENAYSAPERYYHNVKHIADCLRELSPVRDSCHDAAAVEAALLFHDYVYDRRATTTRNVPPKRLPWRCAPSGGRGTGPTRSAG